MAKRTIVRLTSEFAETQERVFVWQDEDGPTYEAVQEAAIMMINHYGFDVGDRLTVTETED